MNKIIKNIFQVDPFPDPVHLGQEIENIGILFAHLIVLIIFMILIIYLHKRYKDYLPILVVYSFSLLIGIECITYSVMPFFPYFSIFFLLFQTSIFVLASLDYYEGVKKKRGI